MTASSTVALTNTTVTNNTLTGGGAGGGIRAGTGVSLTFATVVFNSSTGVNAQQIFTAGVINSFGSVVAGSSTATNNCTHTGGATSWNYEQALTGSCGFTGAGNVVLTLQISQRWAITVGRR